MDGRDKPGHDGERSGAPWVIVRIQLSNNAVIVRLDRTIQYAAAHRFDHWRLWNTGSPAFAGDDGWVCVRVLAAHCARGLRNFRPHQKQKAQGKPGARCTRGLVCKVRKKTHTSIQVQRRHPGFPCAMGYGLLRALPGERLFCPTVAPKKLASQELDASTAASGPHDFAVHVRR